jgi:hypothetical protein
MPTSKTIQTSLQDFKKAQVKVRCPICLANLPTEITAQLVEGRADGLSVLIMTKWLNSLGLGFTAVNTTVAKHLNEHI